MNVEDKIKIIDEEINSLEKEIDKTASYRPNTLHFIQQTIEYKELRQKLEVSK